MIWATALFSSLVATAGRTVKATANFDYVVFLEKGTLKRGEAVSATFRLDHINNSAIDQQITRVVKPATLVIDTSPDKVPFTIEIGGVDNEPVIYSDGITGRSTQTVLANSGSRQFARISFKAASDGNVNGIRFSGAVLFDILVNEDRGAIVSSLLQTVEINCSSFTQNMPVGFLRHMIPTSSLVNGGRPY